MKLALLILVKIILATALNLEYLDPTKLQTKTTASVQQKTAYNIISRYFPSVTVKVNPALFRDKKDVFSLRTIEGKLHIQASTGVAAVWGCNYYLKKYCKSQIEWQTQNINIRYPLPEVDEEVTANDRFRYYQNLRTASNSFVHWTIQDWNEHVEWMALNGINLALAPVAQESAWVRIYRRLGLTEEEIDNHFTGPAFLAWNRVGAIQGWGGPLTKTWHNKQREIQRNVTRYMSELGIIPVLPAFNGHVPKAFARLYPNTTLLSVSSNLFKSNNFVTNYCCGFFLDPTETLFKELGKMFLTEITIDSGKSHIYIADPFYETQSWPTAEPQDIALAIYSTLLEFDENAVWLLQNWMFFHDPNTWPIEKVETFLTSVPNGRMLILDLQSEQWPQYDEYQQYFGQPYVWCMLHNFGGTLGMFGNMKTINKDVYEARSKTNSTMIGVGLTPEGIYQNYVVYDLMLESAWRQAPVDLPTWVGEYAERRYGCNDTTPAWHHLLDSVYSFDGLNKIHGKYVVTHQPSLNIRPWAWYNSYDLFQAFKMLVKVSNVNCYSEGYYHDLVDVTRQALQYRADQLYVNLKEDYLLNSWVFNASINRFLDVMHDMERILRKHDNFRPKLSHARKFADGSVFRNDLNARNQITLWGPNGEEMDYACKQWAEVFHYYYIPRWSAFLTAVLASKLRREHFYEESTQRIVRATVEKQFIVENIKWKDVHMTPFMMSNLRSLASTLCKKWAYIPDMKDLPLLVVRPTPGQRTTPLSFNDW